MRDQIKAIRAEIFRLAKLSTSLDLMHWYIALDDCFENYEFPASEIERMRWRVFVLRDKEEPVKNLIGLIDIVMQQYSDLEVSTSDLLAPS